MIKLFCESYYWTSMHFESFSAENKYFDVNIIISFMEYSECVEECSGVFIDEKHYINAWLKYLSISDYKSQIRSYLNGISSLEDPSLITDFELFDKGFCYNEGYWCKSGKAIGRIIPKTFIYIKKIHKCCNFTNELKNIKEFLG